MKRKVRTLKIVKYITVLLVIVFSLKVSESIMNPENKLKLENQQNVKNRSENPLIIQIEDAAIVIDDINSNQVILMKLHDGSVLLEKNSGEKIYPASLTKMITAIVAIENLPDLMEVTKLTNSTFQGLYAANASLTGFKPGEEVTAIDLLYGVLLPSGAESCVGLAELVAGSEQSFVLMMNQKVSELGMKNTKLTNTTGLHDENHYSTVEDMAIILRYALENDTFRDIITSSRHSIKPTNKHLNGITLYSTMFQKLDNQTLIDGEILGGKTGYTNEAGLCLASLARVGDQEYIMVSAGADGNMHTEQYNITDAINVYNSVGNMLYD